MVATAKRDNTRMIAVVLGAPSSKARFQDASSLLTWGFQHYQSAAIATRGTKVAEIPVRRGTAKSVAAVVAHDRFLTLERGSGRIERKISVPSHVEAPIDKGQVLGQMVAWVQGKEVARVPLVAKVGVPKATVWGNAWRYLWKITG